MDLAPGRWTADWVDPKTGRITRTRKTVKSGMTVLESPPGGEDVALRLRKR
jgi:hypothetical protein